MVGVAEFGRVLLGLCFLSYSIWYVVTDEVRAAYLDSVGAPHFLIWIVALAYAVGGLSILTRRRIADGCLLLSLVLLAMTLLLNHSFAPGGIGEYPPELHGEISFKAWIVNLAIVGSLLLVYARARLADDSNAAKYALSGTTGLTLGRIIVGSYFLLNAAWQWYYYDIRAEHIVATGGNPSVLGIAIAIGLVGGALVASGVAVRTAGLFLAFIITASTILVHGDLSETAPYPPNIQISQWFIKPSILAGLIICFAMGRPKRLAALVE